MSYDIYGNQLRRGHCEVHPHVHEEYPCAVCITEKKAHDQQNQHCDGSPALCESAHYLGQAQEEIAKLNMEAEQFDTAIAARDLEIESLRFALKLALEYWSGRQQRYKNKSPVWVQKARAALNQEQS